MRPVTMKILAALAGALLIAVLAVQHSDAAPSKGPCGRHPVKVVAKKYGAVVYAVRGSDGDVYTEFCDHGRTFELDDGFSLQVQYASVAITPSRIGIAGSDCDGDPPCLVFVARVSRKTGLTSVYAVDPTGPAQVSRLRVGRTGAMVWISCRVSGTDLPAARLKRACRSPRRTHRIYVMVPANAVNSFPTLLDSGHGIDAFSLSIGRKRVIWRHNGRLRSAPIPSHNTPPAP
jgi:hypothetical protein